MSKIGECSISVVPKFEEGYQARENPDLQLKFSQA